MWPIIGSVFSMLFGANGPLGSYIKARSDLALAQQQAALEVKKAEITMATAVAQANVQQSQAQLAATSQGFKTFSYALLTFPIIVVCIWPAHGKVIFDNLAGIPYWYAKLYVAVVGVIWGLPIASSAVSGIFSAVQQSWIDRQPLKIRKLQALNEKKFADQLRTHLFKNGMTSDQWNVIVNAAKSSIEE